MNRHVVLVMTMLVALAVRAQPAGEAKPWETWQPPEVKLPQPNAFDVYLKAFALKKEIDATWRPAAPEPAPPPQPPPLWWAEGPDLPLAQRLALYADVLKLVREALPLECRIPPPKSCEEPLPYFSSFRAVARLFAMEAEARRLDNNYRGAADSALDALEMAQDAKSQQTLLSHLVGIACEAIAFAALDETVPGLTAPECKDALACWQRVVAARPSLAVALIGEKTWHRMTLKHLIANPGRARQLPTDSDATMTAEEIDKFLSSLPEAWQLVDQYFDLIRQNAALPENAYLEGLLQSIIRSRFKDARAETIGHLHELQLAAQAYIIEKGQPPADLAELVPEYIKQIPEDPLTGEPLRGITRGLRLVVYSIGPDGIDDGGVIFENHKVFNIEDKGDIPVEVGAGTNRVP